MKIAHAIIAANVALTVVIVGASTFSVAQLARRDPRPQAEPVRVEQEVRMRRRSGRHYRRQVPLEPGVSPFEVNVIQEPELKAVPTFEVRRWQTWCDRVGGLEC